MDKAPNVGTRVKVKPWHRYHPCTGTVTRVHQIRHYDVADPRWNDPDYDPVSTGLKPERDWTVTMHVDKVPANWDYYDAVSFLVDVNEIDLA